MANITGLLAFKDNYIWVIRSPQNNVIVVDPGDASPVLNYLKQHGLRLNGILLTHHHKDHSGGVAGLAQHYPSVPIYSSVLDKVPFVTQCVQEGDTLAFPDFDEPIRVLDIPGHTLGHIAFLYQDCLFSGDMLFSVGAGKLFEGKISQMYEALDKLKRLPKETLVYCGHEYTLANIAFALKVDPDNSFLAARQAQVQALRAQGLPSLPVTLESELNTNPFLRCDHPDIVKAVQSCTAQTLKDPIEVLLALRAWKNRASL